MSHELRTPLNSILGYAQILKRDSAVSQRQEHGLDIIHQSGNHLLGLITDVLDIAKIEAGKIELSPTTFHLPAFLQNVCDIIRIRTEAKGLFFEYNSAEDLPSGVYGDEKRLRQVLMNLLGNAIEFSDTGTVSLRVYELNELNELNALRELKKLGNSETQKLKNSKTRKLRFQIEDTGVGIPPEQLENIFQPFQQVGDAAHRGEGTGLGLMISRNLIRLMGSDLHVKSQAGEGSLFWFDLALPEVADWKEAAPGEPQKILGAKGTAPTILVVDDKQGNRAVYVDLLSPLGFDVIEATNGQEGLDKATEYRPDVIVADLIMPVLDGFEMIRRIRQSALLKDTMIIAASASVFEEDQ